MNFNPTNEQGLLGLVAALKAGMDPGTAFSVYQSIASDQAPAIANRQDRLGGLSQLLQGAATNGMTYDQASTLMDAQPGPMGPAVNNMLDTYYPGGAQPGPAAVNPRNTYDPRNPTGAPVPTGPPATGPQSMSPLAFSTPDSQMQQMQLQTAQTAAAQGIMDAQTQSDWATVQSQLASAKAKGIDPMTAVQQLSAHQEYASLFGNDPNQLAAILKNVYGQMAMSTAGMVQGG